MGQPGSCPDAAVFKNSGLFDYFNGAATECHIIADGAFPLLKWLMKPYNCIPLTSKQQHFNYCLSSSRMEIENAFGRLKGRWRILNKNLNFHYTMQKQ